MRLCGTALGMGLCVMALGAPVSASAADSVPLHPDPSPPVAQPGGPRPDAPPARPAPASTAPSRPAVTPVQTAPAAVSSAPVRAATTTRTTTLTTTRAAFRPPAVQPTPRKSRLAAATPVRKPKPKPWRPAPLHLGISYALPPPVPALTADRLPLIAASALLAFLLASGSFLGLAYRLRRESFGG